MILIRGFYYIKYKINIFYSLSVKHTEFLKVGFVGVDGLSSVVLWRDV